MPKRCTVEHWREGEVIARVEVTRGMLERCGDGTCRVVFPPGFVTLTTGDELHFDVDGLIDRLMEVRSCPSNG